ncbi:hypothetical protein ZHAS_00009384 [Anopheles sinensis]|uniref:Uncharacterized protein n=1 Tax=Anopheles sinensis TaxID=74873 RepID=A0A084VUV7_ANOSI|nr:hypothetical protein ZHAS_00009384 [Anopheles sinensis]
MYLPSSMSMAQLVYEFNSVCIPWCKIWRNESMICRKTASEQWKGKWLLRNVLNTDVF